ncbi:MAG: sensor histidine kinase [Chitinophagales bacterium]
MINDNTHKKVVKKFFKQIKFKEQELTAETKTLTKKEVQENQLQNYFNWANVAFIIETFETVNKTKVFINYLLENFEKEFSNTTKHEIYNFLLHQKLINNEFQSVLSLFSFIEKNFNNNTIDFAFSISRKAVVYKKIGKNKEALEALNKTLEILKRQKNSKRKTFSIFTINNIIATIYIDNGETDNAIKLFKKNLKGQETIGDKYSVSICYMYLGSLYKKLKKYKLAIKYYLLVQEISEELGLLKEAESTNVELAELYILDNDLRSGIKYIKLCKKSSQKSINQEATFLELLLFLKELKKQEKAELEKLIVKCLSLIEKYDNLDDKLEKYDLIIEAYEYTENYEKTISILNKKHELFAKNIEEQKIESYKQIKESNEIQLQHKELEKKDSLLLQKEALNKTLKRVNDELKQFTSMASHDLKSPLRTILTISDLMKAGDLDKEEMNEYLTLVEEDALKMDNLINSLLKYSKIGYSNIEMEKVCLNDLITGVLNNLKTQIQRKKAQINLDKLPQIQGNRLLLEQLFKNLINNALKYNEKQIPEINIRKSENKKTIEIQDNGIGIPENKIKEIFKAFTRAHSASKYEGSGVGLATCKKIMDIHSGTISVSSEVGKGSCFRLEFNI